MKTSANYSYHSKGLNFNYRDLSAAAVQPGVLTACATTFQVPTNHVLEVKHLAVKTLRSVHVRSGTAPAAGANYTYTVAANHNEELISLALELVADANAANRLIEFNHTDGTVNLGRYYTSTAITAGLTRTVIMQGSSLLWNEVVYDGTHIIPIPQNIILGAGHTVEVVVTNIQVGDQLDDIRIVTKPPVSCIRQHRVQLIKDGIVSLDHEIDPLNGLSVSRPIFLDAGIWTVNTEQWDGLEFQIQTVINGRVFPI